MMIGKPDEQTQGREMTQLIVIDGDWQTRRATQGREMTQITVIDGDWQTRRANTG
jgi:hypothetical protein